MFGVLPEYPAAGDVPGFECFIIFLLFGFLINIAGVDAGLIDMKALVLRLVALIFIHGEIKIYLYGVITLN
jgi:hypothetical protein